MNFHSKVKMVQLEQEVT